MKKFIIILITVISLASLSAQSIDDIRRNVYNSSIEAVNKSKNRKSAYEEYLERQELEAAKKAEEEALEAKQAELNKQAEEEEAYQKACDTLAYCVFTEPMSKDVYIKCYCYPVQDYVWYIIFEGDDNNLWVNIHYNDNGEIGELFYSSVCNDFEYIKAVDDTTGTKTAAIRMKLTNDYLVFIQDKYDHYRFAISW